MPVVVRRKQTPQRLRKPVSTPWGDIIRSLRDESGLSQHQLASMSGVNRNALRRLESNESPGAVDVIEKLCHVLGYELDIFGIQKRIVLHCH